MDLNHIVLPASVLTDFYKTHLIESVVSTQEKPAIETHQPKKVVQYLGKNQKGICLLVEYSDDVYLPDKQLTFLTSILQACKLDLGDVAIINYHREKISFEELRKNITCNYLLIFGVDSVNIGLGEIPMLSIQNISDCCIVYSPAAEQLNNNDVESKLLKSKLWICLKQMFNV